jgi:hypothetical protein
VISGTWHWTFLSEESGGVEQRIEITPVYLDGLHVNRTANRSSVRNAPN